MVSRIPPASPAATMLVYRSSKIFGCLRMASASVEPDSTSCRIERSARWNALTSAWDPRISRHCTSGRPASIMTENCRVKIAMACFGTLPPHFGSAISLPFSLTAVTMICCRRSEAIAASLLSATSWPPVSWPFLPLPFHSNVGISTSQCRGPSRARPAPAGVRYEGRGLAPAACGDPPGCKAPAPREIISWSSSAFDDRLIAVSSVIAFLKYSVASD